MEENTNRCRFTENDDLYGTGIRVGVYSQWLAALLANIWAKEEAGNIQSTAMCFQAAILASLVALTSTGDIQQPEVLVVLPLCFGGFLASSTFEMDPKGPWQRSSSVIRTSLNGVIFCGFVAYSTWFWSYGIRRLSPPACHYSTLLFVRLDIERIRVFGILVSALGCIVFLCLALMASFRIQALIRAEGPKEAFSHLLSAPTPSSRPDDRAQSQNLLRGVIALLPLAHILVMIELTLQWNPREEVGNLSSAGQLIPMIVGILALTKVLYHLAAK